MLCELGESYNEDLLVESASNSTLSTLIPPLCQEKELIVDDNFSISYDEDEERVFFKKLNELENMSIEDLRYLLSFTNSFSPSIHHKSA